MVDVDDGDSVLLVKREQGFVEGAASADAGEFVVVGEHVEVSISEAARIKAAVAT